MIPQAVFEELQELGKVGHDISVFEKSSWLKVEQVQDADLVTRLLADLDIGESESIVLALETKADFLLIDERKGSQKASEMGVSTIGLLRVVLELKDRGIIPAVKPVLDDMHKTGGFWLGKTLYQRVLAAARET